MEERREERESEIISFLFHLWRIQAKSAKKNIRMISLPLHFDLLIHYDDCFEI